MENPKAKFGIPKSLFTPSREYCGCHVPFGALPGSPPRGGGEPRALAVKQPVNVWKPKQAQNSNKATVQMLLENVHKEDIMKRTAQMCKDNRVNVLLLLLFYHLSLIAGSMPAGVGSVERAFS